MKKGWVVVICLFMVIVLGVLALIFIPSPKVAQAPSPTASSTTSPQATITPASLDDLIVVTSPLPHATVGATTVTITGKARGNWYFEASFPIQLIDETGQILAQGQGKAQGDWMTTDYVPFTATLTYPAQAAGSYSTLILKNDNPSGDPAKQKELNIPVTF